MCSTKQLLKEINNLEMEIFKNQILYDNAKAQLNSGSIIRSALFRLSESNKYVAISLPVIALITGYFISDVPLKKITHFATQSPIAGFLKFLL